MVSVLLFFSRFSTRIRFGVRKYRGLGHAVDRPVDGVKSRFSCFPPALARVSACLQFRANSTKFLSIKNLVPSFEDPEHKETCMPNLSGQRGRRRTKRQALIRDLSRLHNAVLIVTLIVLYLLRTYLPNPYKVWRPRNFHDQPRAYFRSPLSCHLIVPIPISHHHSK
jgi:hypothetical protein